MTDNSILLCKDCIKDTDLAEYHSTAQHEQGPCFICKTVSSFCLNTSIAPAFSQIFRALIRFHFSENEYNPSLGGCGVEALFLVDNPIIKTPNKPDNLFHDALNSIINGFGKNNEYKNVSLNLPSSRGSFHHSIAKSTLSAHGLKFLIKLNDVNHFRVEPEAIKLLKPYRTKLAYSITTGASFYRARLKYAKKSHKYSPTGFQIVYFPYTDADISAPPPPGASHGRLNRQGISYLYLSNNPYTAICEIKPHPGQIVTVGEFIPTKDLLFANFKEVHLKDFWLNDDDLAVYSFLRHMNDDLATPIAPSESYKNYYVTQFMADVIRNLGFDGIAFKSSISNGANFVAFDPNSMQYVPKSSRCHTIKSLSYTHDLVYTEEAKEDTPGVSYNDF